MAIYVDQMFNSDSESTSLADMNADVSATTGKYTPLKDGRLLKVILVVGYTASSSLIELLRIELSNTNWTPNLLKFPISGHGLHTAPGPQNRMVEFVIDQPVSEKSGITGQLIHATGTPVTSNVAVYGVFQG